MQRSDFGRLGLEFKIAVRIQSDVPVTGAPWAAETIEPHIGGVCAAIEQVDDRNADYTNLDVSHASCRQFLERRHCPVGIFDKMAYLESVFGRATKDGVTIGEGHGRDVLGHPCNSFAWLAT